MTSDKAVRMFAINRRIVADQMLHVRAETKAEAMEVARSGRPDSTGDETIISQTFRYVPEEDE